MYVYMCVYVSGQMCIYIYKHICICSHGHEEQLRVKTNSDKKVCCGCLDTYLAFGSEMVSCSAIMLECNKCVGFVIFVSEKPKPPSIHFEVSYPHLQV